MIPRFSIASQALFCIASKKPSPSKVIICLVYARKRLTKNIIVVQIVMIMIPKVDEMMPIIYILDTTTRNVVIEKNHTAALNSNI